MRGLFESVSMKRLLGSTAVLLAITVLSKLIGFARELILLERVGIGNQLDIFLVLYGLVNLVNGALGICVVTSLTPIARAYSGRHGAAALMREGFWVGMKTGVVALIASLGYLAVTSSNVGTTSWLLAIIVAGVVPFSLLAEYQVGLFLGRGWRTPVIAGNIIISLPLALALLVFDMGIINYSIGLVASFALRTAIFALLLLRDQRNLSDAAGWPKVNLFGARIWHTLGGGSAMLAIGAVYVTAQMAARQIGVGEATMIGYGLKVPLFILTSVWFVLGTGYFADLVTDGSRGIVRKIAKLSALNFVLLVGATITILVLRLMANGAMSVYIPANSELFRVISQSLPYLPLILFVPLIEMVQRLAVTREHHKSVLAITMAIVVGASSAQVLALLTHAVAWAIWSPVIATAAGCIAALSLLKVMMPTVPEMEIS